MSACTTNIKGLNVVVNYDYWQEDYETGCGDEITINGVFAVGNNEIVDDDESLNLIQILSDNDLSNLESACRIDALKTIRIGEEA